ncbi:MAG: hypothetical protein WC471_03520 [Candidatus Woesearchaeota archaeon]
MKSIISTFIILLCASALSAQPLEYSPFAGNVFVRSLEDGERDLLNQAKTLSREDAYLYHNGRWYDIGISVTNKAVKTSFSTIYHLIISKVIPRGSEVWKYHTHPSKLYVKESFSDSLAISGNDFSNGCYYWNTFNNLGIRSRCFMVNEWGRFEYRLKQTILVSQGINYGLGKGYREYLESAQFYMMDQKVFFITLETYKMMKNYKKLNDLVRKYCTSLEDYGMIVQFNPIEVE